MAAHQLLNEGFRIGQRHGSKALNFGWGKLDSYDVMNPKT